MFWPVGAKFDHKMHIITFYVDIENLAYLHVWQLWCNIWSHVSGHQADLSPIFTILTLIWFPLQPPPQTPEGNIVVVSAKWSTTSCVGYKTMCPHQTFDIVSAFSSFHIIILFPLSMQRGLMNKLAMETKRRRNSRLFLHCALFRASGRRFYHRTSR